MRFIRDLTVRVQRTAPATGSDVHATAENEGRAGVSHRLLAGGGESRRPQGASNPPRVRVHWNEVLGEVLMGNTRLISLYFMRLPH